VGGERSGQELVKGIDIMTGQELRFFDTVISAGAILAGFCSTFLAFRIQREADYYRQPALSYEDLMARDIPIGLQHFTSSFLLIILAAVGALVFGFVIPLFALAGLSGGLISVPFVVAGLVGSLILLAGYFADEMVHYRILGQSLVGDAREWGREAVLVVLVMLVAVGAMAIAYYLAG
jgi:hypothetical protein